MARIKNPEKYIKKLRGDFELAKTKLIVNSYLLDEHERNNLIDCLTQIQNIMEDEISGIIIEHNSRLGKE